MSIYLACIPAVQKLLLAAEVEGGLLSDLSGPWRVGLWSIDESSGRVVVHAALVALAAQLPSIEESVAAVFACQPELRSAWLRIVAAQLREAGKRRDSEELCSAIDLLDAACRRLREHLSDASLHPTGYRVVETALLGAPVDAINTLRERIGNTDPENSLFLASLLGDRRKTGDLEEAVSILREAIPRSQGVPDQLKGEGVILLAGYLAELGHADDGERMLSELPPGYITETTRLATRAEVARIAGRTDDAISLAKRAASFIGSDSTNDECRSVADILTRLSQFAEALPLWKRLVTPPILNPEARMALGCAHKAGDDGFILEFCSAVRKAGMFDAHCVELETNALRRYHRTTTAIEVLNAFIEATEETENARLARVLLAVIGIEDGRSELIDPRVDSYPAPQTASPEIGLAVVQILRHGPNPFIAIPYAYSLLRCNFASPEAHAALVVAVGMGDDGLLPAEPPKEVSPGVAVRFREDDTGKEQWCVIEDDSDPDSCRQELAANHPLAIEMAGKCCGDTFLLRRDPIQDRTATIVELRNKYRYRILDSLEHWEVRFPGHPFVRKFHLGTTPDGKSDLTPVFRALDLKSADTESLNERYRQEPWSVLTFAQLSQVSVPETLHHLAGQSDLPIRCCLGNDHEFKEAVDAVSNANSVVMDPSAAATLYFTGFRPPKQLAFQSCITSAGTMREYRDLLARLGESSSGYLVKVAGRVVFVENDPQEREKEKEHLSEYLTWLNSFTQVGDGALLANWPAAKRELVTRAFGQAAAECIAMALDQDATLWTDDLALAVYASHECGVHCLWTQAAAIFLRKEGHLGEEQLEDLSLKLLRFGYSFTRLTDSAIARSAREADWRPEQQPFAAVLEWIKSEDLRPEGALGLAAKSLAIIWREAPLVGQREAASTAIFRAIAARRSGARLIGALVENVHLAFGLDVLGASQCRDFLAQILFGRGPETGIVRA